MLLRIFTDGACSSNPGPGGWAGIINFEDGIKTISGHELDTTNNRMELTAVLRTLIYLVNEGIVTSDIDKDKYKEIEIYSDSAYVVNALSKGWLSKWRMNGWKTGKGKEVANTDLWKKVFPLFYSYSPRIKILKIKGHNGDTFNEMADKIAKEEVLKVK